MSSRKLSGDLDKLDALAPVLGDCLMSLEPRQLLTGRWTLGYEDDPNRASPRDWLTESEVWHFIKSIRPYGITL